MLVRPTDEHGIRILKRRALPCGRNAVLDLHHEHIPHQAQPLGSESERDERVIQVKPPRVDGRVRHHLGHAAGTVFAFIQPFHPFLHSVHARTCPLP